MVSCFFLSRSTTVQIPGEGKQKEVVHIAKKKQVKTMQINRIFHVRPVIMTEEKKHTF